MTIPETYERPAAVAPAVPGVWQRRAARLVRWVGARGAVHLLLIVAMMGCTYPIAWMFLTSIETDEELGRGEDLPTLPRFCGHSPYVRDEVEIPAPEGVDARRFGRLLPRLVGGASRVALSALPARLPSAVDRDDWARSAASAMVAHVLARTPPRTWQDDDEAVVQHILAAFTPDATGAAVSEQLATLRLSTLGLTTLDGRAFDVGSSPWATDSPALALTPEGGGSVRLDYRFESGGSAPVVVTRDFDMPPGVTAADLHKLVVSLDADGSWHGLDATLDVGGVHWVSTRTVYVAQSRPQSIAFQPPTFDDTTVRARTWIGLRAAGASDGDRRARLTLTLSPSSRLHAIFAKVARNYLRAVDAVPFLRYLGNSLLLVALTLAGAVFSSAFVAYAFARLSWPGRTLALVLLLSTMMVPPQVTMIPTFLVWKSLGWYNTLNPLWVPAWFGNAFFIFLMIQHMRTLPRALEEAACIDGLGIVQTWWYVVVPQLKPSLAAIAVLTFLGAWNEFMGPLIYLRDQSNFPLSLGLFGMRLDHGADWAMLMATNTLMTLPSLIVFFRFQRHFIEGMAQSGIKG